MKKQTHRKKAVGHDANRAGGLETATQANASDLEDSIRKRAFEIHQARGGTPGQELDDWLQAEHEIKGGLQQTANPHA